MIKTNLMNIFNFLFYTNYRMIASIKRTGVRNEDLASQLFSSALFFIFLTISFPILKLLPNGFFKPQIFLLVIYVVVFFIIFFINNYYFKKKYLEIIEYYQPKVKNNIAVLIGILFSALSFLFLIISALLSSKMT